MDDLRPARPWDLFNKNIGRVEKNMSEKRLNICKLCPEYIKATHQCKQCGCIMNAKVKLPNASCPLKKWDSVDVPINHEMTEKESILIEENLKNSENMAE